MLEKQISIRIDSDTHRKIEAIAEKNKRKFSDMTRLILEENLEKYEQGVTHEKGNYYSDGNCDPGTYRVP